MMACIRGYSNTRRTLFFKEGEIDKSMLPDFSMFKKRRAELEEVPKI